MLVNLSNDSKNDSTGYRQEIRDFFLLILKCHPCLDLCSSISLQTFLLDGNSLDELPNELGSLQRLSYLGLSFNQFNHVPQVLEQLASMEKLCMAGNSLEKLSLQNFRLLRVKHIDLRYHYLKIFF